mmetsp:Transcript_17676/g.30705  ORF Transcript_17676/g.30705 Transcript_17676/m.30705 type:complete len:419 (+) Transcript_17676:1-1257(+)
MNTFDIASELRTSLPPKKNMYRLKTYPDTILGSEITKWLISQQYALNSTEANYIATELIEKGHIYNVLDDDEVDFQGGGQLYKYSADDRVQFNIDDVDLKKVELLLTNVVRKKDVVIKYVTFREVFTGSDAVTLMIQKGMVVTREDAVKVGEKMLQIHLMTLIQTSNDKFEFLDDSQSLYSLKDRNRLGNMVGIGAPLKSLQLSSDAVPSDPALSVSSSMVNKQDSDTSFLTESIDSEETNGPRSIYHVSSPKPQSVNISSPSSKMASIKSILSPRTNSVTTKVSNSQKSPAVQFGMSSKDEGADKGMVREGSFKGALQRGLSGKKSGEEQTVAHRDMFRSVTSKKSKVVSRASSSKLDLNADGRSKSNYYNDSRIEIQLPDLESYYADLLNQNMVLDQSPTKSLTPTRAEEEIVPNE